MHHAHHLHAQPPGVGPSMLAPRSAAGGQDLYATDIGPAGLVDAADPMMSMQIPAIQITKETPSDPMGMHGHSPHPPLLGHHLRNQVNHLSSFL